MAEESHDPSSSHIRRRIIGRQSVFINGVGGDIVKGVAGDIIKGVHGDFVKGVHEPFHRSASVGDNSSHIPPDISRQVSNVEEDEIPAAPDNDSYAATSLDQTANVAGTGSGDSESYVSNMVDEIAVNPDQDSNAATSLDQTVHAIGTEIEDSETSVPNGQVEITALHLDSSAANSIGQRLSEISEHVVEIEGSEMAAVHNHGRNAGRTRALGFLGMFLFAWGTNNSIPELRIAGIVILCYLLRGSGLKIEVVAELLGF